MLRIWDSLSPLTEFAIVLISLVGIAFHVRWSRRAALLGPTLLTTLGIFFCFTGIAWGLLDFDPNDVRAGVPHLLDGIRTSFWASVAGIGFALTLKARQMLFGETSAKARSVSTGATVDDLATQLIELNRAVSQPSEASLIGQLKLMRSSTDTRLARLQASFERYAEKIADSNSKALIQALQEVIRDFNTKINEQFGENFKQLNAGIGKLLIWQQRYEVQLNELIEQETATRKNMAQASLHYGELVNKASVFNGVAGSLEKLLGSLETQRTHLESSLGSFAELVNKAASGLPEIESRIVALTSQMESGVRTNQEQLSGALRQANEALNDHVRRATEDSRKHIVLLDKALEEELRRAIESLGRQLTALSQKFVQDYTPLTAQLQRVLQSTRVS